MSLGPRPEQEKPRVRSHLRAGHSSRLQINVNVQQDEARPVGRCTAQRFSSRSVFRTDYHAAVSEQRSVSSHSPGHRKPLLSEKGIIP